MSVLMHRHHFVTSHVSSSYHLHLPCMGWHCSSAILAKKTSVQTFHRVDSWPGKKVLFLNKISPEQKFSAKFLSKIFFGEFFLFYLPFQPLQGSWRYELGDKKNSEKKFWTKIFVPPFFHEKRDFLAWPSSGKQKDKSKATTPARTVSVHRHNNCNMGRGGRKSPAPPLVLTAKGMLPCRDVTCLTEIWFWIHKNNSRIN